MKKQFKKIIGLALVLVLCLSIIPTPAFATEPLDDEDGINDTSLIEPENELSTENDLLEIEPDIINVTMEEFCEMVISNTYVNPSFDPSKGYLVAGQFYIPPVEKQDPNVDYTVPHLCTHHATQPAFMPYVSGSLWHNFDGFTAGNTGQEGRYTATIDGQSNAAFCATPEYQAMTSRSYNVRATQSPSDNPLLAKILYYGSGGPSGENLWSYSTTHWMAAHAYSGSSYNGSSDYASQLAQASAKPLPPSEFVMVFYGVAGESLTSDTGTTQQRQSFVTWYYNPPPPNGHLEIRKTSSNPTMSSGNPQYSLEGAVFDVYSGNTKIGSVTTNASGVGRLNDIDPNLTGLHLVEVQPPKGYALNSARFDFSIVSDQTTIVTVSNRPQNDPVGILLRKRDADTNTAVPQGNAGLAGAEFTLRYYAGLYSTEAQLSGVSPTRSWVVRTDANGIAFLHQDYLVSGDPFYFAGNNHPTLPLGTLTIQESKPPVGYLANPELFIRQITPNGVAESVFTYSVPIVPEAVIRGGVAVEKWDIERNQSAQRQGDAELSGAVFEIINRSTNSVVVNGTSYAPNTVVHTMTTNANGVATTTNNLLPYGIYEIRERTAPNGYLPTGVLSRVFNITQNGVIVNLRSDDTAIKNNIIRGGVAVEKWDIERNQAKLKQGDATLQGAEFEIVNRSPHSVLVQGTLYSPNTVVHSMTTNANGFATTTNRLLPYGTYEIRERTAPNGYLPTGILSRTFSIRVDGAIVNLNSDNTAIKNDIIRGGVYVEKWDNETGKPHPQGGTTFEGAVFEIINRSADSVLVQGKLYAPGEVVYTMKPTDSKGTTITSNDLLPYGTYEVREVSPPNYGYLATGILNRTFTIREHGKIVELNTADTAIRNNPIRGDLRGVKISEGDAKRLANVPFRITSKTTGESHVIVTDANGEINTHSSWNPHSQNTNRGETDLDGIWFGEIETLNDDLGALLYDTYIIEELRCEANKGYELLKFEVSIYRHMTVVNLGTMTNIHTPVPEIFTTAMERESSANTAFVSETTTILDTVYYSGLIAGREYTVKGILMDKETGKPLLINGETVTAERTFRAFSDSGTIAMEFTFNSLGLVGKSVVVFEELYYNGELIAEHTDIEDEYQTINFLEPKIGTLATGANGEKELDIRSEVTLIDTVSYENLKAGETYIVVGRLMDKETGEPLLIDGKAVTSQATFTASRPSGTAEVEFVFNSINLIGKTVVVFEYLYWNGRLIAEHTDIEDEGQTVTFRIPKIKTTATGKDGNKIIPLDKEAVVIDVVEFENLAVGETYTLVGRLMDKETGKPVLIDGKEVLARATFVANKPSGSVEITFTFDSTSLENKTLVVFEYLYYEETLIAEHTDINDEAQTVTIAKREPQPEPGKPGGGAQTGQNGIAFWLLAIALGALATTIVIKVRHHGKKR